MLDFAWSYKILRLLLLLYSYVCPSIFCFIIAKQEVSQIIVYYWTFYNNNNNSNKINNFLRFCLPCLSFVCICIVKNNILLLLEAVEKS